jgi:hypothetical protein
MALTLSFTVAQSADCDTLTFTETTGDQTGGYGDAGNPLHTDVKNTRLEITLPDDSEVVVDKSYLPAQAADPNGTFDFFPADVGYDAFPNGVWDVIFKVYTTDTAPGAIVEGSEYIVTGAGYSITYDGNSYTDGETFIGTSEASYSVIAGTGEVNILEAQESCGALVHCGVRECIKTLMLQECGKDCDCRDDFMDAINMIVIDYNTAQLAFNDQNYDCASAILKRLEEACGGICDKCNC